MSNLFRDLDGSQPESVQEPTKQFMLFLGVLMFF